MNPVEGISVTNSTHKRSSKRLKYKATNLNYYKLELFSKEMTDYLAKLN